MGHLSVADVNNCYILALKVKQQQYFFTKKTMCIIIDVLYAIDICMSTLIRFRSLLEIFFYSFITIELVINEHSTTKKPIHLP